MTISSDNLSNTLNEMESLIVDESSIFLSNATVIRSSITTTSDNSARLSLPISSAIAISSNNLSNTLNEMESLIVAESSIGLITTTVIRSSITTTSDNSARLSLPISSAIAISSNNLSNTLNEMESLIVAESSIVLINATVIRSSITTTSDNSARLSLPISSAIAISSNNLSNTLNEMESLIVDESSRYLIIFVDITSSIVITSCRDFRDTSSSTVSAMARESTLVPSVSLTNTLNEMESLIVDESSIFLINATVIRSSITTTSDNSTRLSLPISSAITISSNNLSNTLNEMESLIVDESSRYLIIFVDITSSIVITSCRDFRDTSISTVSAMARESTLVPSVSLTNTLNEMESLIVDESSIFLINATVIRSSITTTSDNSKRLSLPISSAITISSNNLSNTLNEMESSIVAESSIFFFNATVIRSSITTTSDNSARLSLPISSAIAISSNN